MIAILFVQSSYTDKNSQYYCVRRHLNDTWHNNGQSFANGDAMLGDKC